MDYAELLFALKMQEHVMQQLRQQFKPNWTDLAKERFISENFEGYLIDALDKVERTAYLIKDTRHK